MPGRCGSARPRRPPRTRVPPRRSSRERTEPPPKLKKAKAAPDRAAFAFFFDRRAGGRRGSLVEVGSVLLLVPLDAVDVARVGGEQLFAQPVGAGLRAHVDVVDDAAGLALAVGAV